MDGSVKGTVNHPGNESGNKSRNKSENESEKDFPGFSGNVFAKRKKLRRSAMQSIAGTCIGLFALFCALLLLLVCLGSFHGFAGLGEEAGGATFAGRLGEIRLSAVFGDLPLLSKLPDLSSAYDFAVRYAGTSFRFSTAFVPKELLQFFSKTATAVGDSLWQGLSALFSALVGFLTKGY